MKTLIRGLGVGALLLAGACFYPSEERGAYRAGDYGGAGLNVDAVEEMCARTAMRQGWDVGDANRYEQTSEYTAKMRFDTYGRAFRRNVTCYYDARSNIATVR